MSIIDYGDFDFAADLRNRIASVLKRKAVYTIQDEIFQPTEADMMDSVRSFMEDAASVRQARKENPSFDAMPLDKKYAIAVYIRPDLDVAQKKLEEARRPIQIDEEHSIIDLTTNVQENPK